MNELKRTPQLMPSEAMSLEIAESVEHTLNSLFGISATRGATRVEMGEPIEGDVSAFVSLIDTSVKGSFVLSFPAATICAMMSKMYGKEITTINKTARQGAGELANMMFGKLAASLFQSGFKFEMAVPNVIVGEKHSLEIFTTGVTLVTPFQSAMGEFSTMLVIYDQKPAASN